MVRKRKLKSIFGDMDIKVSDKYWGKGGTYNQYLRLKDKKLKKKIRLWKS